MLCWHRYTRDRSLELYQVSRSHVVLALETGLQSSTRYPKAMLCWHLYTSDRSVELYQISGSHAMLALETGL